METNYHIPVLKEETIRLLNVRPNTIIVDGTLGGGGHTSLILNQNNSVKVIGIDRDLDAITFASSKLKKYIPKRFSTVHSNYKEIISILENKNIMVDGILLDLGVSSYQLDNADRGFSFRNDAPLDMRMNQEDQLSASDVVNEYSEESLVKIFSEYGEEKFSKRIAKGIVSSRPINTTGQLKEVVASVVDKINPKESSSSVQRVFQAIRIEVNDELNNLYELIVSLPSRMNKGARLAVITFHSLEDRIVKRAFKELTTGCICPPKFPICVCGHIQKAINITKKPVVASTEELNINARARSAKLRVLEIV